MDRGTFCGGHWNPQFWTLDDSAHEFLSQGGLIITYTLLFLVLNDAQSHLWLPGLGIEPGLLTPEASTIPLCQPYHILILFGTFINCYENSHTYYILLQKLTRMTTCCLGYQRLDFKREKTLLPNLFDAYLF